MKLIFKRLDDLKLTQQYLAVIHVAVDICQPSWTQFRDSCYKTFALPQGISWLEAEQQCAGYNSHLTSIMDQEEMQVIHYLILTVLGTQEAKTYIGKLSTIP